MGREWWEGSTAELNAKGLWVMVVCARTMALEDTAPRAFLVKVEDVIEAVPGNAVTQK